MTTKTRISKLLCGMKRRCADKNNKYYGGKGIKVLITKDELIEIWKRDKACSMQKPSIDRINSNGNYEYSNCRFIEFSENVGAKRGELNPKARLKESDIIKIRRIYSRGDMSFRKIALIYKVGTSTIKDIILRITWGFVF